VTEEATELVLGLALELEELEELAWWWWNLSTCQRKPRYTMKRLTRSSLGTLLCISANCHQGNYLRS
jgi:hypothetical protein